MRHLKFFFLLMAGAMLVCPNLQAQWFLTGNFITNNEWLGALNTSTIPLRIKTEDALDINFYTNAGAGTFLNQRMTITSTGLVGINNLATPSAMLHIEGNTTSGGELFTTIAQNNTSPAWRMYKRNGVNSPVEIFSIVNDNPQSNAILQATSGALFFSTGGSNVRMVIDGNGMVGIGLDANYVPNDQLEVATTTGSQLRLTNKTGVMPHAMLGMTDNGNLRIFLEAAGNAQGTVGIGTNVNETLTGRLHVKNASTTSSIGINVDGTATSTYGIKVSGTGTGSIGVLSSARSLGLWGVGNGKPLSGSYMAGVLGEADGSINNNGADNNGVVGSVSLCKYSAYNRGVRGIASASHNPNGASTVVNHGVWGEAANGDNNYGVYGKCLANGGFAGYFEGRLYADTYLNFPSDEIFKTDVTSIEDGLSIIQKLKPSTYHYITDKFADKSFPKDLQYGFIANDVAEVIPEIVHDENAPAMFDTSGNIIQDAYTYKTYQPEAIIPLLVRSIQQLKETVDAQQSQLNDCCNSGMRLQDQGSNPSQSIKIISESIALLGDCAPNPTDGNTIITVKVPEKISEALIIFTDQLGKEVFREVITNRGYSD
ncbi:MAG: tail fiber domain-containing protein, partial [Chitinophagales bacterium]|nr:tail fiber domain-containing protein [Chitinophagales bacterium]